VSAVDQQYANCSQLCTLGIVQVYKAQRHGTTEVAVKFVPCLVDDPQKLHQAVYIFCSIDIFAV